MPLYDFECPLNHVFEVRCSVADREAEHLCPETVRHAATTTHPERHLACDLPGKRVILQTPHIWKNIYVLDYPGSKALKAGYVHTHGDPGGSRVSSGYGGSINPKSAPIHPLARNIQPEEVHQTTGMPELKL